MWDTLKNLSRRILIKHEQQVCLVLVILCLFLGVSVSLWSCSYSVSFIVCSFLLFVSVCPILCLFVVFPQRSIVVVSLFVVSLCLCSYIVSHLSHPRRGGARAAVRDCVSFPETLGHATWSSRALNRRPRAAGASSLLHAVRLNLSVTSFQLHTWEQLCPAVKTHAAQVETRSAAVTQQRVD